MKQKGFFDEKNRLEDLSKLGDPLEKLNKHIAWENIRETLNEALRKEHKGLGGRPPFDYVLMFKILILQKLYNMSDDKTENIIMDRLSFQRLLGIQLWDKVPDAKTIWNFREELNETQALGAILDGFVQQLEEKGIVTHSESIVDVTLVDVPRQRNTREENKEIKEGKVPEEWEKKENRHKKAQKDADARWATKNKKVHFGYKDHINMDKKSKIIMDFTPIGAHS